MTDRSLHRRTLLAGLGTAATGLSSTAAAQSGANFAVSVEHSPAVVNEGEESLVTGEITNTGDEEDVQIIELEVSRDGEVTERRSTTVQLAPGETESRTERITYDEYPGPGEYVGEVCSDDDCGTASWTVAEPGASEPDPASFAVTLSGEPTTVAGRDLRVTATVTNTGSQQGQQELTCTVEQLGKVTKTVALGADESTTVEFVFQTRPNESGRYATTVSSADASASTTATVQPRPASFRVQITDVSTPVAGDDLAVTAVVENDGGQRATQSVTLAVDNLGTMSRSVELAAGEQESVRLRLATGTDDAGTYTATVSSDDSTAGASVTVQPQPANVGVGITGVTAGPAGDPVEVTAAVENTGGQETTTTVTLDLGALGTASTTVTLAPGDRQTVVLSVPTAVGDGGTYTAVVEAGDSTARRDLNVTPQSKIAVSIESVTTGISGEPVTVTAVVTNTGGAEASEDVSLDVANLGTATQTVSLQPGAEQRVTLSVPSGGASPGEYTARVTVGDASATAPVRIDPKPASFTVDVDLSSTTAGDAIEATVSVENTGGERDTQTITVMAEGLGEQRQTVTLEAGERRRISVAVQTTPGDAGEYTVEVSSEDDAATATVTVTNDNTGGTQEAAKSADDSGPGFGVGTGVVGTGMAALSVLNYLRDSDTNTE